MDWTVPSSEDNRTVEIAVIKVPATVPVTDPRYGKYIESTDPDNLSKTDVSTGNIKIAQQIYGEA